MESLAPLVVSFIFLVITTLMFIIVILSSSSMDRVVKFRIFVCEVFCVLLIIGLSVGFLVYIE